MNSLQSTAWKISHTGFVLLHFFIYVLLKNNTPEGDAMKNWCCRENNKHKLQKKDEARDKWELKSNEVTLCEELGHGAFGKVCKGILKAPLSMKTGQSVNKTSKKIANSTITVAVKMLQGMWLWFLLTHKHNLRLRPHYTGEIWKQRLHSENTAKVFRPHYNGEI